MSHIPTFQLLATSFVGLAACWLIDKLGYGGTGQFQQSPIGLLMIILFGVVWCGTLFVLIPFQVFYHRRRINHQVATSEIDPATMPGLQQQLFYANCGGLPRWLWLPFVIVAIVLGSILALGLILGIFATVWTYVFGT